MIVNKDALLLDAPIKHMVDHKVQDKPTSWGLTECGYDIRIKQEVRFYPHSDNKLFNPAVELWENGEMVVQSVGNFILASSVEEFDMPCHLMGRVLNKSTWARQGLDSSMATNIEPGWKGFLTLELVFNGPRNVIVPAGCGISQVIFESLSRPAQYTGKYQNQGNGPVDPIA